MLAWTFACVVALAPANQSVGNSLSCIPPHLNSDDYFFCYDDASKTVNGKPECQVRDGNCNDEYGEINQGQTRNCEIGYDCTDCGVYKVDPHSMRIDGKPMRYPIPGTGWGQGNGETYRNFDCCHWFCRGFHMTGVGCEPCSRGK